MANIKFLINKKTAGTRAQLSVRFYAGREHDYRVKTRIYVPVAMWQEQQQRLVIPRRFATEDTLFATEAQRQIDELTQFIFEQYSAVGGKIDRNFLNYTVAKYYGEPINEQETQNKAQNTSLEWYLDNYPTAHNLEPRTAARYAVLKRIVERYSEKHHPLYLHNLSVEDLERFEAYLRSGEDTQRCDNTIGHKMKCIRAVCNWARKRGEMQHYPFDNYRIKAEVYGTPNFLTLQERDAIYNTQIENPSLAVQRDIFIFQCHIGCRISDLYKLTEANITQDGNFIQYIQEKMRRSKPQTVRVPLTDTAKEIIERYRHRNRNNRLIDFRSKSNRLDVGLFPFISEQRYNDAIKDILRLAGINRVVLVYDPVTSKNTPKQICDIASSHLARRTFMANVFKLTKSERITSAFTGHVENSKAFSRYTDVDDELKLDIIKLIDTTEGAE
jgi:integrase